jgi:phage terminase small subunit
MRLNLRQRAFVCEYLIDLNATQAALRAGYSQKTAGSLGHELLKKPEIEAAISEAMKDRQQRTLITADKVLTDIELIKSDAMRTKVGNDGNAEMINHGAALRACELQGKHLQLWTEKSVVEHRGAVADLFAALSGNIFGPVSDDDAQGDG